MGAVIQFFEAMAASVPGIIALVLSGIAALGMIFAVYLGIKLATAEGDDARKNIKNQIIYTIIAVAIVGVMALILGLMRDWGEWWWSDFDYENPTDPWIPTLPSMHYAGRVVAGLLGR